MVGRPDRYQAPGAFSHPVSSARAPTLRALAQPKAPRLRPGAVQKRPRPASLNLSGPVSTTGLWIIILTCKIQALPSLPASVCLPQVCLLCARGRRRRVRLARLQITSPNIHGYLCARLPRSCISRVKNQSGRR